MMNTSTSPTGAIDVDMSRGGFDEAIFKSIQEEVYPSSLEVHEGLEWDYYPVSYTHLTLPTILLV